MHDIVNGVLFLASDLSRSITGTTLHIDGGTSADLGFLDWPYGDRFMPTLHWTQPSSACLQRTAEHSVAVCAWMGPHMIRNGRNIAK